MDPFDVALIALGVLVLVLGLPSRRLSLSPFPPTLLALVFGVVVGPAVLGWLDPAALGDRVTILERIARITLAVGLVGVALRVPRRYPRTHGRDLSILVGAGMPLMWGVSTGLVTLVLGVPLLMGAVIGAAVTATDPITASPIVTGELAERSLPVRIRHLISFESGANDGLAYLFVLLPFLLLTRPADEALRHWLLTTLLWEVLGATAFGLALGWSAGRLLRAADDRRLIEGEWRLIYTVALALVAAGAGRLLATDEVLVIFAAGAAFVQVVRASERDEEEHGQEAVNRFVSVPFFALLGTVLPWEGWRELGGEGLLLAVAVLLLRRPVAILLLGPFLRAVKAPRDALFLAWFGPLGAAAIYYAAMMEHRLDEPLIWPVTTLLVCASVVAHGATAAPLTRWYGRRAGVGG
jgi:sodium/hydrogen antiporter